jgi:2'-5' RNA ligase
MQSRPYDIVIFPPDSIRAKAIELSDHLSQFDTYIRLSKNGPYPHISLYQAEFPLVNLDKVKTKLTEYVKSKKIFSISPIDQVYQPGGRGYLEVQYPPVGKLLELHQEVIELLNPLREDLMREAEKARFDSLPEDQQENIKKWGYSFTGPYFRPHITLARLKDESPAALASLDKKDFSFNVGQIGIFELGPHGTCVQKVAVYDLAS